MMYPFWYLQLEIVISKNKFLCCVLIQLADLCCLRCESIEHCEYVKLKIELTFELFTGMLIFNTSTVFLSRMFLLIHELDEVN